MVEFEWVEASKGRGEGIENGVCAGCRGEQSANVEDRGLRKVPKTFQLGFLLHFIRLALEVSTGNNSACSRALKGALVEASENLIKMPHRFLWNPRRKSISFIGERPIFPSSRQAGNLPSLTTKLINLWIQNWKGTNKSIVSMTELWWWFKELRGQITETPNQKGHTP